MKEKRRRKKGTGSISCLGKGRNKPFLAAINRNIIGTFKTYDEAEKALNWYNLGLPYDQKRNTIITFKDIWDLEFEQNEPFKSTSWKKSMLSAFKNLDDLHNLPINRIKAKELQNSFDKKMRSSCSKSTLNNMLIVCRMVFKHSMKMDYISKDYSAFINIKPTTLPKNNRKPFTVDEINYLIKDNTFESKLILIYIFSGTRPIELLQMKKSNVFIDDGYMVGGVKTNSGKNRIIPIHKIVIPYLQELIEFQSEYLLNGLTYSKYLTLFKKTMKKLGLQHDTPYDTRYTFSTLAKTSRLDTAAHKKIMGHSCNNITDDIYTHEPIQFLINELNKIELSKAVI